MNEFNMNIKLKGTENEKLVTDMVLDLTLYIYFSLSFSFTLFLN